MIKKFRYDRDLHCAEARHWRIMKMKEKREFKWRPFDDPLTEGIE